MRTKEKPVNLQQRGWRPWQEQLHFALHGQTQIEWVEEREQKGKIIKI